MDISLHRKINVNKPLHSFILLTSLLVFSNMAAAVEDTSKSWYQSSLIHAHTRFSTFHENRLNNEQWLSTYLKLGTIFPSLGFSNYTRHLKSRGEEPYLLSESIESLKPDLFESLSNSNNGNVIWYYWINSNSQQESEHPEWICKSRLGLTQAHKNSGTHLDLASGYEKIYKRDIQKILAGPAKGIYFDWRHYPPTGCYGTALEAEFIELHPDIPQSQYHRAFEVFKGEKLSEVFSSINQLKSSPDQELIISSTSIPTLVNPEMRFSQLRAGVPKNEFFNSEKIGLNLRHNSRGKRKTFSKEFRSARLSLGLDLMSDISGRKPHIWIHKPSSENDLEAIVATTLVHNSIANIDFSEKWLIDINLGKSNPYIEDIQHVAKNASHLEAIIQSSKKVPTVRLVISEQQRDRYSDLGDYFEDVIMPLTKAYQSLLNSGITVDIADDTQLQETNTEITRTIVPDGHSTTSEFQITLSKFLENQEEAIDQLKSHQKISVSTSADKSELHVRQHEDGSHSIIHLNDYSWVTTESYKSRFVSATPESYKATINIDLTNLSQCFREISHQHEKFPIAPSQTTYSLQLTSFYDVVTVSNCL